MTTPAPVAVSDEHRTALALLGQGHVYEAVDLASRCLRADPDNVELRNALLVGYGKLGLAELAAETAEGFGPQLRDRPEIRAAVDRLRQRPARRVQWSVLNRRFERNLAVLAERCPELAVVGDVWRRDGAGLVEMYRCSDGNNQICRRNEQGLPVWWPRIADHRGEADRLELPNRPGMLCSPFLFEGFGTHGLFDQICRATHRMFVGYSPALYVVEPDPRWVAAVLHLYDWQDVLAQDRVLLFVGPEAVERFGEYLMAHDQAPIPGHRVRHGNAGADLTGLLTQAIDKVTGARNRQAEQLAAEVEQAYAPRGPRFLNARFNQPDPADPLRIMFLVSRFTTVLQYTVRTLADGFRELGYPTEILTEASDFACLSPVTQYRRILDLRPDIVIIPDHIRAEYGGQFPPQVVVATWMQDRMPHLFKPEAAAAAQTVCEEPEEPGLRALTDYMFGYYRSELVDQFGYPTETYLAWPVIPSDPRIYRPVETTPELISRYGCEVAFLSHGGEPPEQALAELLEAFEPAARPVVKAVFETARDRYRGGGEILYTGGRIWRSQLQELAETLASEMGVDPAALSSFEAHFNLLNDRLWRHAVLGWLVDMDIDVRLYGQGWDQHPVFARFARPPVNDPDEICAIYGCAKVNLQTGAYSAVHQRLINGLFAGGFFLVHDSSYNYYHFEHRDPDLYVVDARTDERRAALNALVELARRGCDSFDDFTSPANCDLAEALVPVIREVLMPHERDDIAAIWREVEYNMLARPAAVFPDCWGQVTFQSRDELAERVDQFCRREPDRRNDLAAHMRQRCLASYGSERLARRLLQQIGDCLAESVNPVGR